MDQATIDLIEKAKIEQQARGYHLWTKEEKEKILECKRRGLGYTYAFKFGLFPGRTKQVLRLAWGRHDVT